MMMWIFTAFAIWIMTFAGTAMILANAIQPFFFIAMSLFIGIAAGLIILIVGVTAGDVAGVFMSAKLGKKDVIGVITATNRIQLIAGTESSGMIKTKNRGYFLITPGSVYRWPNGVSGTIAFYKYGAGLPLKIMKAATRLKENNIMNMGQFKDILNNAKKNNQDIIEV